MLDWLFNINQLVPKKKQSKSGIIRQIHCSSNTFKVSILFKYWQWCLFVASSFRMFLHMMHVFLLFFYIKHKKLYLSLDLNTLKYVSNVIMTHLKWPLPILSLLKVKLSSGWGFWSELLWEFIARREMSGFPGQSSEQKPLGSELGSWELNPGLPWSCLNGQHFPLFLT